MSKQTDLCNRQEIENCHRYKMCNIFAPFIQDGTSGGRREPGEGLVESQGDKGCWTTTVHAEAAASEYERENGKGVKGGGRGRRRERERQRGNAGFPGTDARVHTGAREAVMRY